MQYIKECLQLLYWIYFKPYTLKRHVQAICPEITNPYDDNIYRRSAEAKANPQLQRYDDQGWWLTVLVPIVVVFFCTPLVAGVLRLFLETAAFQFNWMSGGLSLSAWLLVQMIFQIMRKRFRGKFSLLYSLSFNVIYSVTVGVTFGVMAAGGTVIGMVAAGLVAFGLAFGAMVTTPNLASGVDMAAFVVTGVILVGIVGMIVGFAFSTKVGVVLGISLLFGILRGYFWLPELLWTTFLKFAPILPARRLSCLPAYYDQVIILPLPFIPTFIAQAYQENQAAARQTIDYLITSTNQQKAAQKAMGLIAVEECSHCRTAKDIAAIRDQLSWISNQQSPGLTACLDISQDVIAALEASSLYRKAQQLDKVIPKIDRQRNALAAVSAREATSFGSVLDSWQRILETARRTLHEQAAQSNEIPQVYLVGPALDPNRAGPLFKGRRDLFRQIETLTLSAQHPTLVMHGGRRSGKTSTLNYLPKWLPSDILPLLIDGQSLAATSTLAGFAEDFAEQLTRSAHKVHALQLPTLESIKQSDDPFVRLRRWLDAIEQNIPNKTLLLCLDEFERLDEIVQTTGSRVPLNFLRHLIQHRDNWTLLFTGALTPEELPAYWSDYLINSQTLRISYLTEADCLELIQQPVEDFPDIYPAAVAQAIRELTGGQPSFTQLLCHELVEQLNRDKVKTVRIDDLETVLPAVFINGYYCFNEFWCALSEEQRTLLTALAQGETVVPERHRTATSMLVRKEILSQENSGWSFRVPLIQQWIVNNGEGGLIGK
ncbi:MAG: AAA family ATPase [Candidatus Electrothrix sp. AX1]|nr:AAA family ATPase [Candidatus Electrothrix sp. AX1]